MTSSLENYLEAILELQSGNCGVRVTDIAKHLNISKSSVHRACDTLRENNLITQEFYGTLSLTGEGLKIAKSVAFNHSMIKNFLAQILGVDEETAEEDACRIEHVISRQTIEHLTEFMKKALPFSD